MRKEKCENKSFTREMIGDWITDPGLLFELAGIPEDLVDGGSLGGCYEIVGYTGGNVVEIIDTVEDVKKECLNEE